MSPISLLRRNSEVVIIFGTIPVKGYAIRALTSILCSFFNSARSHSSNLSAQALRELTEILSLWLSNLTCYKIVMLMQVFPSYLCRRILWSFYLSVHFPSLSMQPIQIFDARKANIFVKHQYLLIFGILLSGGRGYFLIIKTSMIKVNLGIKQITASN